LGKEKGYPILQPWETFGRLSRKRTERIRRDQCQGKTAQSTTEKKSPRIEEKRRSKGTETQASELTSLQVKLQIERKGEGRFAGHGKKTKPKKRASLSSRRDDSASLSSYKNVGVKVNAIETNAEMKSSTLIGIHHREFSLCAKG